MGVSSRPKSNFSVATEVVLLFFVGFFLDLWSENSLTTEFFLVSLEKNSEILLPTDFLLLVGEAGTERLSFSFNKLESSLIDDVMV